jgi:hypothetical protein
VAPADFVSIRAQFVAITDRVQTVARSLGHELLSERPAPGHWSVAECLSHLRITADGYLPIWREAIRQAQTARSTAPADPFRQDLWGRFFVWLMEPPPKIRFPAPRRFVPIVDSARVADVLPTFLRSQDEVLNTIDDASGLPLDRIVIRSAFSSYVRYSLWSSLCANAAHHRRHVWQAEQAARAILAGRDR